MNLAPSSLLSPTTTGARAPSRSSSCPVCLTSQVKEQKLNRNEAAGLDGVSPRVLCSLCRPAMWNSTALLQHQPEPSHIMKVPEKHLLAHLNKQTSTFQDPLQFAYHRGAEVEDTIMTQSSRFHSHLDKAGSTVRIRLFRENCSLSS